MHASATPQLRATADAKISRWTSGSPAPELCAFKAYPDQTRALPPAEEPPAYAHNQSEFPSLVATAEPKTEPTPEPPADTTDVAKFMTFIQARGVNVDPTWVQAFQEQQNPSMAVKLQQQTPPTPYTTPGPTAHPKQTEEPTPPAAVPKRRLADLAAAAAKAHPQPPAPPTQHTQTSPTTDPPHKAAPPTPPPVQSRHRCVS